MSKDVLTSPPPSRLLGLTQYAFCFNAYSFFCRGRKGGEGCLLERGLIKNLNFQNRGEVYWRAAGGGGGGGFIAAFTVLLDNTVLTLEISLSDTCRCKYTFKTNYGSLKSLACTNVNSFILN